MWEPSTSDDDVHVQQSKRIEALCAHRCYIQEHVLNNSTKMSCQVLRGGRLWIDGCWAAESAALKARNITAIVALGDVNANYAQPPEGVARIDIVLEDDPCVRIKDHFDSVTQWIHDEIAKPRGRVLVHCAAGVSRSATICMAYLMRFHHLSLGAAYAVVLEARPIVDPNRGFLAQLGEWEGELVFRE